MSNNQAMAAWAEFVSGPGWSNRLVWYLVYELGQERVYAIQPEEQTEEMLMLIEIAAAVNSRLTAAVNAYLRSASAL